MKKVKPVIQSHLKDCGVSVMEYIINYYGGYIPLEKLREDTYTSQDGTNFYHMINAFSKWGFDAQGVVVQDLLKENLVFPVIAHLLLKNGLYHFVVIKKISKNTIYLMDPSVGYKKMTINEFNELFTGNIIKVFPRSNVIKLEKGITIFKLFMNILNKEKFLVMKITLISLVSTILLILSSYHFKVGMNLINSNQYLFKYLVYSFALVILLKIFTFYIRALYENRLNNLVDVYVYPEFIRHLFSIPLKNIKSRSTGEIMTRVEELTNIKSLFSDIFVSCVIDSLLMIISLIVLILLNKKLSLVLITFIGLYFIMGYIFSKMTYKRIIENIDYQTEFNSVLVENISMIESIKNLNVKNIVLNKIEKALAKYLYNNYLFSKFFSKTNLGKDFLIESAIFIINSYGLFLVLKGTFSIVDLVTFNMILSYCLDPVKNVINLLPKFNYIKASFSKIAEFINIEEENNKESKEELKGDIEFKNVSYSYNDYNYVLKDCNLIIKEGEHVLLNGTSGSGKSTICKLIYKENIPNNGEILINNINLKDILNGDVKKNILYVSQNELLFTESIKENILMGRDISNKKFFDICKVCELESIVNKKNIRYESLIEPSSKNLSGGEVQRIILARALLKDANILILDEALSEVDIKLESKIIKNIRKYFKDKTIIYISHKNQTHNFENIINLEVKS